jgi:hypothetical protein
MAKSIDTDIFMQTHSMIDCRRMAARITPKACVNYQKNNDTLACVGCYRCAPGEIGRAIRWWEHVHARMDVLKEL